MKRVKGFTLDSGTEKGFGWYIQCEVTRVGTFNDKGGIRLRYKTNHNIYLENKKYMNKRSIEDKRIREIKKGLGFCLICGTIDPIVLIEHHVFGRKSDEITITLCANCHQKLHFYKGAKLNA